MRVAPSDAKPAVGYAPSKDKAALVVTAKNPGMWGNDLRVLFTAASKAKAQILEVITTPDPVAYRLSRP